MAAKSKSNLPLTLKSKLQEILLERYELARAVSQSYLKNHSNNVGILQCHYCGAWEAFEEATHKPGCVVILAKRVMRESMSKKKLV